MNRLLVIVLLAILWPGKYLLADNKYDARLYDAFISGNMTEWVKVLNELEIIVSKNPTSSNTFQLLHARYGYIGYLLGVDKVNEAKQHLDKAEREANSLVNIPTYKSTAKAMQAALMAFRITISPFKAPILGPKIETQIDEALTINPFNYYAIIEKGNLRHYAPSIVGGNPAEAVESYRQAIELIEKENSGSKPKKWWYLNTYTQMGLAVQKLGNKALAKKVYQTILSIEPNYQWVKEELLPNL